MSDRYYRNWIWAHGLVVVALLGSALVWWLLGDLRRADLTCIAALALANTMLLLDKFCILRRRRRRSN